MVYVNEGNNENGGPPSYKFHHFDSIIQDDNASADNELFSEEDDMSEEEN